MAIHCALLINRAFTYGVIKEKNQFSDGTQNLSVKSDIKEEQSLFLRRLYEEAGNSPSKSVDAYAVGRELGFDEEKIDTLASRLLTREFITKGDIIPISTGDPPPSRKYLLVRITSKGMSEMDDGSIQPSSSTVVHNDNRQVNVNVNEATNPRIQVAGDNSIQTANNVGIDVNKLKLVFKEVRESLNATDLDPKVKDSIETAAEDIEQELSTPNPRKESILGRIKTFLSMINSVPALVVLEEKILTALDESGIDISNYFFG